MKKLILGITLFFSLENITHAQEMMDLTGLPVSQTSQDPQPALDVVDVNGLPKPVKLRCIEIDGAEGSDFSILTDGTMRVKHGSLDSKPVYFKPSEVAVDSDIGIYIAANKYKQSVVLKIDGPGHSAEPAGRVYIKTGVDVFIADVYCPVNKEFSILK